MNIRSLSLLVIVNITFSPLILPAAIPVAPIPGLPHFLTIGSFAQYEQAFSNNETHELYWGITGVNSSGVEISVRSHGMTYNSSDMQLYITPGGGIMLINAASWFIHRCILCNGTDVSDQYAGNKVPFWIPASVNESTAIDTIYDNHIFPTSVDALEIEALPEDRDCWMTESVFGVGSGMTRWYDKTTGIVLKILTSFTSFEAHMTVVETLNATNVQPLLYSSQLEFEMGIGMGLSLVVFALAGSAYFLIQKRKRLDRTAPFSESYYYLHSSQRT